MQDKSERKIYGYGHISTYIGFDPYHAWRTRCHDCNAKEYLFDDRRRRLNFKKEDLKRGFKVSRCKSCRSNAKRQQIEYKVPKLEAFHLNDIRFRQTEMQDQTLYRE